MPVLTSVLDGEESASRPWETAPDTHCVGNWMDPGAGLNFVRIGNRTPVPLFVATVQEIATRILEIL
jgi:hypothetical protein